MDEVVELIKELVKEGYRVLCRGAMCSPVPVRKIAVGTVIIERRWRHEYKEIDSENCIYMMNLGDEACRDCASKDICDQWFTDEGSETEEIRCFALDLGTSGVAGQGYSDEEYWYFSDGYEVDHENKRIVFSVPLLGGFYYRNEDHYLNGYKETEYKGKVGELIVDLSESWKPRTRCGCI